MLVDICKSGAANGTEVNAVVDECVSSGEWVKEKGEQEATRIKGLVLSQRVVEMKNKKQKNAVKRLKTR